MDADSGEVLLGCVEHGIPVICDPCPMAGGTSPFTLAGTLVLMLAENMFLLTAAHVLDPDLPVLVGGAASPLDMRSAEVAYGAIERRLMMLASLDVFRMWGIPTFSPGNSVDSCLSDVQIGAEKTWTYLTAALSDPCAGVGVGAVTNGKAVSLEQMVIDRDLLMAARRFAQGVDTSEWARAKDVILSVPHGGSFLMEEHTLERLHGDEYVYPDLFNRAGPEGRPILERAHERVEKMLDSYRCPVDPESVKRLDEYIDAEKRTVGIGV
jgi:trimethylamine--corrinoid protein Co-methyltransferase